MKTELTIEESLKREKGMIFPQDFSEKTLLAVSHNHNCVEALKKQIPIKVVLNQSYYSCPVCGTIRSIKQKHNFCHDCGQALDWEN